MAIQKIAGYMLKQDTTGKPAFRMAPTCIELSRSGSELLEQSSSILVTSFEAGYIWDTKAASEDKPNIRKPKKGTRYDDLMNALEYGVIGENIPFAPSVQMLQLAVAQYQSAPERAALQQQLQEARLLKQQQRDYDPSDDRGRSRGRRGLL
jgi:hypothetical protein